MIRPMRWCLRSVFQLGKGLFLEFGLQEWACPATNFADGERVRFISTSAMEIAAFRTLKRVLY